MSKEKNDNTSPPLGDDDDIKHVIVSPQDKKDLESWLIPTTLGDIPMNLSAPSPFDNMTQEEIDGFWDWIS